MQCQQLHGSCGSSRHRRWNRGGRGGGIEAERKRREPTDLQKASRKTKNEVLRSALKVPLLKHFVPPSSPLARQSLSYVHPSLLSIMMTGLISVCA